MSDDLPETAPARPARRRLGPVLALVAVALGGALYLATLDRAEPPVEAQAARLPAPVMPSPVTPPPADSDTVAVAEGPEGVEGAGAPAALSETPRFDLVRVAPDGAAVVAGRAAPGAVVTVYADAAPLAEAEADAQGNFVAIFDAVPAAVPQTLTLGAQEPGGPEAVSEELVVLLPETPVVEVTEAAEATDATDAVAVGPPVEGDAEVPGETAEVAPPAAAPARAAGEGELAPRPRVAATAILRPEGVEVQAGADGPAVDGPARQVSLASISYAEDGAVTLAGLGAAGARLMAYVDDGFSREGVVADDGRWSLALGDVAVGVYRLRIDQIDGAGRVASRVETPFQRDLPRAPRPRPATGDAGDDTGGDAASGGQAVQVTVQPGANLWTLARVHYGAGVLYTQIFLANQDLIRDPHLIYPGQIFDLPEVGEAPPPG